MPPPTTRPDAREARAATFGERPRRGGYEDKWVKFVVGPLRSHPEHAGRVRAVRYHDLTTWSRLRHRLDRRGEIGAWESRRLPRPDRRVAAQPVRDVIGLWVAPRAVWRAFARGPPQPNLYGEEWGETLLDESVGEMRRRLALERAAPRATLGTRSASRRGAPRRSRSRCSPAPARARDLGDRRRDPLNQGDPVSYTCFDVSLETRSRHIRLSRPEAYNSMVPEFWRELPEIVRTLDDAGEARAIVLSSTGKHFTAGMDLAVFTSPAAAPRPRGELGRRRANLRREILRLQETFSCLDRARMPVLAAVQGGCIGGGVDMISACDIRYCSEDAFFCIQEINIGMTADVGTFPRLPHLIPQGVGARAAYTGRRLTAREALDVGLGEPRVPDPRGARRRACSAWRARSRSARRSRSGAARRCSTTRATTRSPTGSTTSPPGRPACSSPATCSRRSRPKSESRKPPYPDLLPVKNKL
jgi:enoyl-CoA hydratase